MKTKYAKIGKLSILLSGILFLLAFVMQFLSTNIYFNFLYAFAILFFSVGGILVYIAARKDKEHMKAMEIIQKDERFNNITVLSKAKAVDTFSNIFTWIILICVAFFKDLNVYILMVIMAIMPLLLLALQVYYYLKLSKKM